MNMVFGLLMAAVLLALYLLPALVAAKRDHHQFMAILLLNIFLGWTFFGWVGALVWSATAVQKKS